jgi:hypothetical protein
MTKTKRKVRKVKAKPVRASKTPWERTYPVTRKRASVQAMRAMEQPRVKGRFARKPTSDYDLGPRDFYAIQQAKLERKEITPDTYERYARKYEQRNPQHRFKGARYRITIEVTGIKDEEGQIIWRVITEGNEVKLTRANQAYVKDSLKIMYGDYIKIQSLRLYGVYDKLTGKRLLWRP